MLTSAAMLKSKTARLSTAASGERGASGETVSGAAGRTSGVAGPTSTAEASAVFELELQPNPVPRTANESKKARE
jgi:hypothetical protein